MRCDQCDESTYTRERNTESMCSVCLFLLHECAKKYVRQQKPDAKHEIAAEYRELWSEWSLSLVKQHAVQCDVFLKKGIHIHCICSYEYFMSHFVIYVGYILYRFTHIYAYIK